MQKSTQDKWNYVSCKDPAISTMVLIAFTVVTGEDLDALTGVMNALTNLQEEEQAKGMNENSNSDNNSLVYI